MKRTLDRVARLLLIGGSVAAFSSAPVFADLVGGTYTSAPSTTTWPGTPVYTSLASGAGGLGGSLTAQGFPGQDSNADGALLSELVTPTSNITLGGLAIDVGGIATFATGGMSLHIYSLAAGQAFTSGGLLGSAESPNNGVYNPYPGPDLLGNGTGLPFSSAGTASGAFLTFNFDNGTTNDNVTLAAGTTYAIEFWDLSQAVPGTFTTNQMSWLRASTVDPGGGMFAGTDTLISATASSATTGLRGTISERGLSGGAPRTGAIALYAVPEPATIGIFAMAASGLLLRRRKVNA